MMEFDDNTIDNLLPTGFDPHNAVEIIGQYLNQLEKAFQKLKKNNAEVKRNFESEMRAINKIKEDQAREIERLTSDLYNLTHLYEDQESTLLSVNHKVMTYEKQLKKISREHSDLENNFMQKENDANFYLAEVERLNQDHNMLTNTVSSLSARVEELEIKLASEKSAIMGYEKEERKLKLMLSESQAKINLLESKLEDNEFKHKDDIKKLSERITQDMQHEVVILKKRIKSNIAPELKDIANLEKEKISVETANILLSLVHNMVVKLEQTCS